MGVIFSVLYLLIFCAAGWGLARRFLPGEGAELTIPLGCGFGVSLLALLPAAAALIFGFTLPAVLLAGCAALAAAVLLWVKRAPWAAPAPGWQAMLACVLPLLLIACLLLNTHILNMVDGSYHTGQSCYGDTAMHLAFIKSIAVRGSFPPFYPLLAGDAGMNYPFLCETVSSCFLLLGANLRLAYLLPVCPALISVFGMGWQLARRVLGHAGKASLAFWLFFMGSGFGFCYFLASGEMFASIFTGFYTTPTNYTAENIIWVNPVVDLLIPQRATLFGWCVLFPALYLLWCFAMEGEVRLWAALALLVLPLPLMHTHSALALVLCCLACGVYTLLFRPRSRENLLPWLALALVCGAVWLVEMWGTVFAQTLEGENMLRLHFNWINGNDDGTLKDNYFWFYIKNIGVVYLLLIPAFIHAKPRQRWFYSGGLLILALAEFVVFQPNNYDNNKLLYIWHLLGCILAAQLIWDVLAKVRSVPLRSVLAACTIFLATFGSVLTVMREGFSDYIQWGEADIAVAEYVDANAEPDALFLTDDSHLQPVASLAGRNIVCGSGSFVYFHGMDYSAQYSAMQTLYTEPNAELLAQWGIDYVLFGSGVYSAWPQADEAWYAERYELWYSGDGYRIYKVAG